MSESNVVAREAPLEAKLAPSFTIRCLLVAAVCLVLGVGGVWDYVEIIPRQERFFSRAEVCRTFNRFAEPVISGSGDADEAKGQAVLTAVVDNMEVEGGADVQSEVAGLRSAVAAGGHDADDRLTAMLAERLIPSALKAYASDHPGAAEGTIETPPTSAPTWLAAEAAIVTAVMRPVDAQGAASQKLKQAMILSEVQLQIYGDTEAPSSYDRPVQWLFILCLPFVPWYLWQLFSNKSKVFRLQPDGALDIPGETWAADEIADIDMGKWMRTSKAWVVHTDGRRVLLDDYVFKNSFRIVGAIASERYPDDWTDEARKVKAPPSKA